ncbi:MAG: biotin--[acetyl-CoA-carboxylase] ligase [Coriobacteriales bacterium]|nr:biotin--[acetyl-CoA-carboxylase] ligase [Coriobacteriales bacterium]
MDKPTILTFDEVTSTNDVIKDMLKTRQGQAPLAVVARAQTAGRGRYGHKWASPGGGLYISVAPAIRLTVDEVYELQFDSARNICRALCDLMPDAKDHIHLKWPNDIMADNGKLAGILVERPPAVVGIGLNVERPQRGADARAAYLSDITSTLPSYDTIANAVIASVL